MRNTHISGPGAPRTVARTAENQQCPFYEERRPLGPRRDYPRAIDVGNTVLYEATANVESV